ncbi:MAG: hypothetical protein QUS11_07185 [Candidatus Fermentibacter sp.]|nr:hypothetical protein [Candidatus Fermentibacter sp.]
MSGRIVKAVIAAEFQPGWHSIQLGNLFTGIYFVRMRVWEFEAASASWS